MIYDEELMTEEITAEKKLWSNFFAIDFGVTAAVTFLGVITMPIVSQYVKPFYIAGCFLIGVLITREAKGSNPKKRIYESIQYLLKRPKTTYLPVELEEDLIESEED